MLVNYFLVSNYQAIETADRLGLRPPDAKFIKRTMVLNIRDIFTAGLTQENNIGIVLTDGCSYEIEYHQHIWEAIIEKVNEREKS